MQSSMRADQEMKARLAAYNWATSASFGRGGEGPPKVLGDVLESVAGAVYVDCGFNLKAAWEVGHKQDCLCMSITTPCVRIAFKDCYKLRVRTCLYVSSGKNVACILAREAQVLNVACLP